MIISSTSSILRFDFPSLYIKYIDIFFELLTNYNSYYPSIKKLVHKMMDICSKDLSEKF